MFGEQTQSRTGLREIVRFSVPPQAGGAPSSRKGVTLTARGSPGDRQPLDAVDELRQQPRGFLDRDDVGYLAAQFVEHDPDLTTSQVGAQAEMGTPAAEAEMRIGVARHVKSPRGSEL